MKNNDKNKGKNELIEMSNLPDELIFHALKFLNREGDLLNFSLTNKKNYGITHDFLTACFNELMVNGKLYLDPLNLGKLSKAGAFKMLSLTEKMNILSLSDFSRKTLDLLKLNNLEASSSSSVTSPKKFSFFPAPDFKTWSAKNLTAIDSEELPDESKIKTIEDEKIIATLKQHPFFKQQFKQINQEMHKKETLENCLVASIICCCGLIILGLIIGLGPMILNIFADRSKENEDLMGIIIFLGVLVGLATVIIAFATNMVMVANIERSEQVWQDKRTSHLEKTQKTLEEGFVFTQVRREYLNEDQEIELEEREPLLSIQL